MSELENELKVTALMERIGQIATEYEGKIADLRVQTTILVARMQERVSSLEAEVERLTGATRDATVGATDVSQEQDSTED